MLRKKTKSKDFSVFNVQDIRIQYVFKTTTFYTKIMMKIMNLLSTRKIIGRQIFKSNQFEILIWYVHNQGLGNDFDFRGVRYSKRIILKIIQNFTL